jgi:hypothetical protein
MVSEVGLNINGSSSFFHHPCVTTAHSGANHFTCSFSLFRKLSGISIGKYTFLCHVFLMILSKIF